MLKSTIQVIHKKNKIFQICGQPNLTNFFTESVLTSIEICYYILVNVIGGYCRQLFLDKKTIDIVN